MSTTVCFTEDAVAVTNLARRRRTRRSRRKPKCAPPSFDSLDNHSKSYPASVDSLGYSTSSDTDHDDFLPVKGLSASKWASAPSELKPAEEPATTPELLSSVVTTSNVQADFEEPAKSRLRTALPRFLPVLDWTDPNASPTQLKNAPKVLVGVELKPLTLSSRSQDNSPLSSPLSVPVIVDSLMLSSTLTPDADQLSEEAKETLEPSSTEVASHPAVSPPAATLVSAWCSTFASLSKLNCLLMSAACLAVYDALLSFTLRAAQSTPVALVSATFEWTDFTPPWKASPIAKPPNLPAWFSESNYHRHRQFAVSQRLSNLTFPELTLPTSAVLTNLPLHLRIDLQAAAPLSSELSNPAKLRSFNGLLAVSVDYLISIQWAVRLVMVAMLVVAIYSRRKSLLAVFPRIIRNLNSRMHSWVFSVSSRMSDPFLQYDMLGEATQDCIMQHRTFLPQDFRFPSLEVVQRSRYFQGVCQLVDSATQQLPWLIKSFSQIPDSSCNAISNAVKQLRRIDGRQQTAVLCKLIDTHKLRFTQLPWACIANIFALHLYSDWKLGIFSGSNWRSIEQLRAAASPAWSPYWRMLLKLHIHNWTSKLAVYGELAYPYVKAGSFMLAFVPFILLAEPFLEELSDHVEQPW